MSQQPHEHRTILSLLAAQAARQPDAPAIVTVAGATLTFGELVEEMSRIRLQLRSFGIGPLDRVASVLPDGAEAAVAFLGVSASAIAAPLNPATRERRLRILFQDIPARALLVQAGASGEAVDVARALGIQVLEMVPRGDRAGTFDLRCELSAQASPERADPTPDQVALVLYTSGTTSRPKLVPLTHDNLAAAAGYTGEALQLGPADRALHVVPMFHVQGLVTSLLAPLAAGGAVICAPGFQPQEVPHWLRATGATWYTAVPTMHQAIVERASRLGPVRSEGRLRFVRSSASALSVSLAADLAKTFGVPVVNGYGMTEASPIIASTPLPPAVCKPGSVGRAAGPEVTILDDQGRPLGPGAVGEVAVRGANVMKGYERNPAANAAAFVNGWFRTGDQGFLDKDGYLFLTGRLQEIINRGGEKISPGEVEDVLLQHPAVAAALVFGMPDASLGEVVAAAVVRRSGYAVTEQEVRQFVASKVAFFKIPVRVCFVSELPTGPTGKMRRVDMARQLGVHIGGSDDPGSSAEVAGPVEAELVRAWRELLGHTNVAIHDNFFVLGGTSIQVAEVLANVQRRWGVQVPEQAFLTRPTIAELASEIECRLGRTASAVADSVRRMTVPLQPAGDGIPLFLVHPGGAGSVAGYTEFATSFGASRPTFGIQAEGDWWGNERPYHGVDSLEELAARYVQALRSVRPRGPYHLGGYSFGGTVAFEMARQLASAGERVASLFLLCTHIRNGPSAHSSSLFAPVRGQSWWKSVALRALRVAAARCPRLYRLVHCHQDVRLRWSTRGGRRASQLLVSARFYRESRLLVCRYIPGVYDGVVLLIRAAEDEDSLPLLTGLARGGVQVRDVPGGHLDLLGSPLVGTVADFVRQHIERAEGNGQLERVRSVEMSAVVAG